MSDQIDPSLTGRPLISTTQAQSQDVTMADVSFGPGQPTLDEV